MAVNSLKILKPLLVYPLYIIDNFDIVSNPILYNSRILNNQIMCKLHLIVSFQPTVVLISG